ncbi:hypothetical protein Tco_0584259 [Tanacetum coccineum]
MSPNRRKLKRRIRLPKRYEVCIHKELETLEIGMVKEEMNAEKEEVLNEMQNDEESVDIQNLGANDKGRNGECAEKSIDEGKDLVFCLSLFRKGSCFIIGVILPTTLGEAFSLARLAEARFEESVKNHFGPSKYEDSKGALSKLLQLDLSKATNPLQAKELLQIKEMADQDTPPPTITAMKIPIIKKGEYDIWSMRMRQYICHTDHNLWDIIVNGDLEDEATPSGEQSSPPVPKTAKQLAARRNQERIKSILLLAIPDEYLLKFHNVPDAKSLWAAIKSRFGGNQESKKMQKNVLKHQFENFVTASNETLDKAYDRFQKLISQLEIHGAYVSKEDINQKFLRSLPPSWSQIALIMRNKPDIDEIDIDDLYNNLRVYEDEMKKSSTSSSNTENLAFISSENSGSTNTVNTVSGEHGVSAAVGTAFTSQVSSTTCTHDVSCSFFAHPTTSPQLENEDFQQIDGDDLEELDLRWQVAMLIVRVKKKGYFARECRSARSQGRRPYGDRSNAQTTESSSQVLVA